MVINLVKCAIGAGSFALPAAFVQVGMVFGIILLVAFGMVAAYTMGLLADAEKYAVLSGGPASAASADGHKPILEHDVESHPPQDRERLTYPQVMRVLFPDATVFGYNALSAIVTVAIILTSVLVSVAYVLFISTTFHADPFNIRVDYVILLLVVPVALLAQLRTFKYLAFTSILGDVAVTAGIVSDTVSICRAMRVVVTGRERDHRTR